MSTDYPFPAQIGNNLAIAIPGELPTLTSGTLSMVSVGFALLSIILFNPNVYSTWLRVCILKIFKSKSTSIGEIRKIASAVKINFRVETTDWMVYSLLVSTLLQSFAGQLSYAWIYKDITSPDHARLCYFQGVAIGTADLSTAFWSGLICFYTMRQLFKLSALDTKKIGFVTKVIIFCVCYAVPMFLTFSVHLFQTDPSLPVFIDAGNHGWCFIGIL